MAYKAVKFIKTAASGGREWQPGMVIHEGDGPDYWIQSLLDEGAIERMGFPEPVVVENAPAVEVEDVPAIEVVEMDAVEATAAAEALAEELDIDLADVQGTGLDDRITKGDVQEFADSLED